MSLFFHRGRCFICLLEEKRAALLLYLSDLSVNEVTVQGFVQHCSCMTAAGHRGQSRPLIRPLGRVSTLRGASGCYLPPCGAVKMSGGNRCPPKVHRGPFFNLLMPVSSVRRIQPLSSAGSPETVKNGVSLWCFSALHTMHLSLSATASPCIIYRI